MLTDFFLQLKSGGVPVSVRRAPDLHEVPFRHEGGLTSFRTERLETFQLYLVDCR